jgi:hypothetical protein
MSGKSQGFRIESTLLRIKSQGVVTQQGALLTPKGVVTPQGGPLPSKISVTDCKTFLQSMSLLTTRNPVKTFNDPAPPLLQSRSS